MAFRRMSNLKVLRSALFILLACTLTAQADEDETATPARPKIEGRPVYAVAGKVVVFPENMEAAPKDYRGVIGARPLALIRLDDKIVGEIFAAPLKGTPAAEAKDMAASADDNPKIELLGQETIKEQGKEVEVVTLKFDFPSKIGQPWVLRSLYYPLGESSTTFKLAASETNFKKLLPYFETMLNPMVKEKEKKSE